MILSLKESLLEIRTRKLLQAILPKRMLRIRVEISWLCLLSRAKQDRGTLLQGVEGHLRGEVDPPIFLKNENILSLNKGRKY